MVKLHSGKYLKSIQKVLFSSWAFPMLQGHFMLSVNCTFLIFLNSRVLFALFLLHCSSIFFELIIRVKLGFVIFLLKNCCCSVAFEDSAILTTGDSPEPLITLEMDLRSSRYLYLIKSYLKNSAHR